MLAASLPNIVYARNIFPTDEMKDIPAKIFDRYPAIDEAVSSEVVGVAHFDLDRLKKLVDSRPELAKACWDWGFGDWETAIGAASHVARRDILAYLLEKGARPDIFTFAMMGSYHVIRLMIEQLPGIQRTPGPHGISLLQHVKNGMQAENGKTPEAEKLLDYLVSLGDSDAPKYQDVADADKQKYLGDFKYGDGPLEGFSVKLNLRKLLTLGKIGKFGGALYKIDDNRFTYNGAPSVFISFHFENDKIVSLTVTEPGLVLTARKI